MAKIACGIDPGLSGAIVVTDGQKFLKHWPIPILVFDKEKEISFMKVFCIFKDIKKEWPEIQVFLERAVPFAMGTKSAFNYGQGFQCLKIALETTKLPYTLVEPGKWARTMHQGIKSDLKAKAKSLAAVHRLYPNLVGKLPSNRNGKLLEGPIDALLIAGWAIRNYDDCEDYY